MLIVVVGLETQPVDVCVNVKVAEPEDCPVTTPALVTVAIVALLDVQVPPVVGDNVVVLPVQMVVGPVTVTVGLPLTVMADEALETQPVVELVKVKVALPAATPVTMPALLMVATAVLLDVQVPPLAGERELVAPAQIGLAPVMETTGLGLTVTNEPVEVVAPQPMPVCVIDTL